jgi:archaellum component FlaC
MGRGRKVKGITYRDGHLKVVPYQSYGDIISERGGAETMEELLKQLMEQMGNRFDRLEQRLENVEQRLENIEKDVREVKIDLKHLQSKANTIETRVLQLDTTIRLVHKQYSDLWLDVNVMKEMNKQQLSSQ